MTPNDEVERLAADASSATRAQNGERPIRTPTYGLEVTSEPHATKVTERRGRTVAA